MSEIKRLNWGCGSWIVEGWINSDIKNDHGADLVCDIRKGLPLEDESIDYAVGIHVLPEFSVAEMVEILGELRRVLKPGGVMRFGLPDLLKAIAAYERGDHDYFLIPDDKGSSIGAKLVLQLLWYGYSKTVFTAGYIEEALFQAGFREVHHCSFRETKSPWPEIIDLDNRENESLFVEATK
jgi:ubiquinone/menaquinone biosynthesis C-methylase UbiE